ncbi:Myb-like DNA-binding domain protein [Cooperia oncophora]
MADEEHSRTASSYDGDDDFVEGEDNGEDFEVIDISGTLDEEELLEGGVDYAEELRELEDEGSMDIEELRRRYGYSLSGDDESAEAECDSGSDVGVVADVGDGECETVDVEASESGDFLHLPYDELDEGDDSDDRDYAPPDPWRKDVRVDAGRYQAAVPEGMNDDASLASSDNDNDLPTLPNPVPGGALWMPTDELSEVDIDRFLGDIVELREAHGQTFSNRFAVTRDDEDALCALYRHHYDTDKAKVGALQWDLSERDLFERGIAMYGKNFSVIQKRLLPYRRVGELVEYYYFWKKTDRYQMFRKHTVYAEPDMHCLGPPLFHQNQYAQLPYDGALPEVGGTRVENDGVLPDMAGSGVLPSTEAGIANLSATAASSQPPSEPPAPIAAPGNGDGEPKAERGADIWWNDDVPVAQV